MIGKRKPPAPVREPLIRAAAAAYELWMLLPIWLLVRHSAASVHVEGAAGLLPIAAAVSLSCAALSVPVRARWKQTAAALLISAASMGLSPVFGSSAAALGIAFMIGAMQGFTIHYRYDSSRWYWIGVVAYLSASAMVQIVPSWNGDGRFLSIGGFICLAAALFAANSYHLRSVAIHEIHSGRIPTELKRHNRLFVAFILIGMLLLAAGLGKWLIRGITAIIGFVIRGFLSLFSGDGDPSPPASPAQEQPPPMQLPPPNEPGWFVQLLDALLPYVGAAICLALLGWGAYRLYRNSNGLLRKWLSRLAEWFRLAGKETPAAGYTDEQSSLFSWEEALGKLRGSRLGRLLTGNGEPGWDQLTRNRDRARYLYRRWLRMQARAGYGARSDLTPLETANDVRRWRLASDRNAGGGGEVSLIEVYYKARYAEEEPSDEEIMAIRGSSSPDKRD